MRTTLSRRITWKIEVKKNLNDFSTSILSLKYPKAIIEEYFIQMVSNFIFLQIAHTFNPIQKIST
jgi:hypothetical protein